MGTARTVGMRPPDRPAVAGADRHDVAYADLAASEPAPVEGECVVCFLARATAASCRGWTPLEAYRIRRAPAATGLAERWARQGARCACGVPAGICVVAREHRERDVHTDELQVPDPLPACHGVRPGSAQPCGLWVRGPRRRPGEELGCSAAPRAQPAEPVEPVEPADSHARRT